MGYKTMVKQIKADSFQMAALPLEVRNAALAAIAEKLGAGQEAIFAANQKDLENARAQQLPGPIIDRLKFDAHKLHDIVCGTADLIKLPDPLFQTLLKRELDEGLTLWKVTCPIGVVGVIFESRPDALVQIAALCLKSGNCSILKGGSEAANTNRVLFDLIHQAGVSAGLPEHFTALVENRAAIGELLICDDAIDLLIPRGSNEFVRHIMDNTRIPVMGHAEGVCHIYVDKDADIGKAVRIITDAKTQYAAACNAVETLLVHVGAANDLLPALHDCFDGKVSLRGDDRVRHIIPCEASVPADDRAEYLDYILSIKIVDSLAEAIAHINRYGSRHTDCIVTEDARAAAAFMENVDSAGVYHNCSTRFADGFRYGFGAEVGISTGKLHARGPVGLDGLVTAKYKLYGDGQIVGDYAAGRKSFHFRDL